MPIPKPTTKIAKLAACATAPNRRADLTVAPHLRNTFPARRSAAARVGTMGAASCGHCPDSAMRRPTSATRASSAAPTPARPNHRKGSRLPVSSQRRVVTSVVACGRVSVAATTSTDRAPADRNSPHTSIAAEYHMLRHAISETTLRSRKASGCAFSSDRMGSEGARIPHLVGQDRQFLWLRFEAACRLDELHERLRIHRRGEHPEESPNRPRKRKRDARLDVHPADVPPAGDQRSGQCIGDLAQLSGLRIEVHDRPRGRLLGRRDLGRRGHGRVSDSVAADTAVRCMNETTNRPDSGTMHNSVSPSLIRPSVIISSRMTKMAALPMFPTLVRLLYHISGRPMATLRRENSPNMRVFMRSLE